MASIKQITVKRKLEDKTWERDKLVEAMQMRKDRLAEQVYRNMGWIASIKENPYMKGKPIHPKCAPPLPIMPLSFYKSLRKYELAQMYSSSLVHAKRCQYSELPPDPRWVGQAGYYIFGKSGRKKWPKEFISKILRKEWR